MEEVHPESALGTFPARAGNQVNALVNGDEIFPAMLDAIRRAERSVFLETYIYWNGEIARTFAETLASQARHGVDVRVVLDWVGCYRLERTLIDLMEAAGVRVQYFRPLRWYSLRRFNHRTHRKLMVVDDKIGFIGGVGIADQWTGDAQDEDHWRDNHYEVRGPVVADLRCIFHEHWNGTPQDDQPVVIPEPVGSSTATAIAASPAVGRTLIRDKFLDLIAQSERRLAIVTPYFMPGEKLLEALHDARSRNVGVQVLTCGRKTDRDVVRYASRHRWGELLDDKIRIFEYEPTLIHTKTLLVDDQSVFIGSANFDCRSSRINDEANLLVEDPDFAAQHWEFLANDLAHAHPILREDWSERSIPERTVDAFAHLVRGQL